MHPLSADRRLTGVLVSLLLVLPAGCGARSEPAAAEKPFDATAALAGSTAGIEAGDYTFRLVRPGNDVAIGEVHRPSRSIGLKMTMKLDEDVSVATEVRLIGSVRYQHMLMDAGSLNRLKQQRRMIMDLGRPNDRKVREALAKIEIGLETFGGERWAKLDKTKVKDSSSIEYDVDAGRPDVTGAGALVGGAVTAEGDPATIKGTLDASRITGTEELLNVETFKEIDPATAKAVPYVATLDTQGRLTRLALTLPAAEEHKAGRWVLEFTDYGAARPQEPPPAAEIKEATPEMYDMFNAGPR